METTLNPNVLLAGPADAPDEARPEDDRRERPPLRSHGLLDLVVRDDPALDDALLDDERLPGALTGLLAIALFGLAAHGLAVGFAAWHLGATSDWLAGTPVVWMPLALVGAFVGTLLLCLPTFYFHTQLAGLDAPFRLVAAQGLRVLARTSVLLLGAMPFYVAFVLLAVLGIADPLEAVLFGLVVPFLVGLAGKVTLYQAFGRLRHRVPITHPRRGDVLLRMVVCWGGLYTVMAPVALWKLGSALGAVL